MKKYIIACRDLYFILCAYNRRVELQRLVDWAKRKRFSGPRRLYQSRLVDEEKRLFYYAMRSPRLTRLAYVSHRLNIVVFGSPRYPRKGSAVGYR